MKHFCHKNATFKSMCDPHLTKINKKNNTLQYSQYLKQLYMEIQNKKI